MKILDEKALKAKLVEKRAEKNINDSAFIGASEKSQLLEAGNKKNLSAAEDDPEKAIKKYLLSTLSRREYSVYELQKKLNEKDFDPVLSDTVLQSFIEEGLQSDQRFCEMFIRSRIAKNSGPFKIRMELNAKGVAETLINQGLSDTECDWSALALDCAKRKTASWKSFNFDDKGKLMRFLQGRGFDQDQIRYAVKELTSLEQARSEQTNSLF